VARLTKPGSSAFPTRSRVVRRPGRVALLATLGVAVLLAGPTNASAAKPKSKLDALWKTFPLQPAPVAERLQPRRVVRSQTAAASTVGGDSNEVPIGILLWLAAAAAGVAIGAKAVRMHAVQELVGDGLARLPRPHVPRAHLPRPHLPRPQLPRPHRPRVHVPRPGLPRVHVPRPHLPHVHIPRPELPRVHVPRPHLPRPELPRPRLPQLPSNRVVQNLAGVLDRARQTLWRADVLFWTTAMAAATAFGVLIALYLGGP
jgi:hypothetical protein